MDRIMKIGLVVLCVFVPVVSSAEQPVMAKDEWVAFQQQQREEQMAFSKKQREAREQFLKDHPQVAAHMEQQRKEAMERSKKMSEEMRLKREQQKSQPPQKKVPVLAVQKNQVKK